MDANKLIQITHLPKQDEIKKQSLINAIEKSYGKLTSFLPGELMLEIHFRESKKQGNREQFEVKANANVAGISLHSKFIDWDSEKALKQALTALEKEAIKAKTLKR
ncbi:MAG: hypothetical protein CL944_02185 [Candidatus Diapherotrites archaeon]|uniref:HPF/RaiA family ribosome-associated protein n=1 Tax=Candidatus Iainarchaeum sp. TaxID=3101447 RepID=A0A2D6LPZ6_9ARCH|nr:hypothetical protein [Candidatus Diapherotrites archaeon]|tara:strand:+ start:12411 stop:12728 length:318 start_codon:yes stop_codon:yes gene_type:complete